MTDALVEVVGAIIAVLLPVILAVWLIVERGR